MGTNYTFSVEAFNAVGASPASVSSKEIPVLATPTMTRKATTVTVTWTLTELANVKECLVTLMPGSKQCTTVSHHCSFTKLSPKTSYTATLSVFEAGGTAPSAVQSSLSSVPLPTTQVVTISGFLFTVKGLTKAQIATCEQIALLIAKDKSKFVRLDASTDNTGTRAVNERVSFVRVRTVLAQLEIDTYKLGFRHITWSAIAHANGPYVALNNTAAGRAANRRVTVTITFSK